MSGHARTIRAIDPATTIHDPAPRRPRTPDSASMPIAKFLEGTIQEVESDSMTA